MISVLRQFNIVVRPTVKRDSITIDKEYPVLAVIRDHTSHVKFMIADDKNCMMEIGNEQCFIKLLDTTDTVPFIVEPSAQLPTVNEWLNPDKTEKQKLTPAEALAKARAVKNMKYSKDNTDVIITE